MTRSMFLVRSALIALVLSASMVVFSSCAIYESSHYSATNSAGFPYSLPKTAIQVTVEKHVNAKTQVAELLIAVTKTHIPDNKHRYLLNPSHSEIQDDLMKIKVNEAGLLEMVNVTTTDQTQNILGSIVDTIGDIVGFGAIGGFSSIDGPETATMTIEDAIQSAIGSVVPGKHTYVFAIDKKDSFVLPGTGGALEIHYLGASYVGGTKPTNTDSPEQGVYKGIYVRVPEALNCSFEVRMDTATLQAMLEKTSQNADSDSLANRLVNFLNAQADELVVAKIGTVVLAPDYSPTVKIPMNRAYLVTAKHDITLKDGMFTKAEINRPSTLNGLVSIPAHIAGKLVAIPKEIIQLKFNIASEQTNLATQQKKLAEAIDALREELENSNSTSK